MTRRKATAAPEAAPVEQSDPFEYIRQELLLIAPMCDHGLFLEGVKIAPLAKEIGVPPVTLSDYLKGRKNVGRVTLTRFIDFLNARKGAETAEQAEALAEVASL